MQTKAHTSLIKFGPQKNMSFYVLITCVKAFLKLRNFSSDHISQFREKSDL